jgi:hypothetical protein
MIRACLVGVLWLAACSSPSPAPTGAASPSAPTASSGAPATPTAEPALSPKLGDKCGDNDTCAPPATCVSYTGIAGPKGPTFKTCEVKCPPREGRETDSACPAGTKCGMIADGPGHVCR